MTYQARPSCKQSFLGKECKDPIEYILEEITRQRLQDATEERTISLMHSVLIPLGLD